jgi:hypothetical protein
MGALVMVGSAGIDTSLVESVSAIRADHVYTTAASPDQLAPFGGAQAFSADGDGKDLQRVDGHNPLGKPGDSPAAWNGNIEPSEGHGYYDRGTQSLQNMAAVTTGKLEKLSGALTETGREAAEHNRQSAADLERLAWQTGLGR